MSAFCRDLLLKGLGQSLGKTFGLILIEAPHDKERLAKHRAISQKTIERLRKAYEQAQARTQLDEAKVAELEAALHAAEINIGYTNIVAPVDGTIVSCNVKMGQTVTTGSEAAPLFLIAPDASTPK
jgi:HlyD family secretion protein